MLALAKEVSVFEVRITSLKYMNQSGSFMLHLDRGRKTLADYFDEDQDSFVIYRERDTHTLRHAQKGKKILANLYSNYNYPAIVK